MPAEAVVLAVIVFAGVAGAAAVALGRRGRARIPERPDELAERASEATEGMAFRKILVPTVGSVVSDRMVSLACKLARLSGGEVEVVYVIEIPLALPASAELPEQTQRASEALAEAQLIGRAHGVPVRGRVTKSRFAGKAIVDVASDERADLIILGTGPRRHGDWGRTSEYVFRNAPCDVIIERSTRP